MPDDAPARFRFGRESRLRKAREFSTVRAHGERAVRGCLIANWKALPPGSPSKLGVVTSRKIGTAVVRSRARRLMREAFRLHQHDFADPLALVLVARNSILEKRLADVERDFLFLMRRASLFKSRK